VQVTGPSSNYITYFVYENYNPSQFLSYESSFETNAAVDYLTILDPTTLTLISWYNGEASNGATQLPLIRYDVTVPACTPNYGPGSVVVPSDYCSTHDIIINGPANEETYYFLYYNFDPELYQNYITTFYSEVATFDFAVGFPQPGNYSIVCWYNGIAGNGLLAWYNYVIPNCNGGSTGTNSPPSPPPSQTTGHPFPNDTSFLKYNVLLGVIFVLYLMN